MMLSKGSCYCILHLLHRVGSTNLFAYRNVIKRWTIRVFGTKVRERLLLSLSLVCAAVFGPDAQTERKAFVGASSVFRFRMAEMASPSRFCMGRKKWEKERKSKKRGRSIEKA